MSSEKTEQPTPKKLRDARKKGQVAHSKDVSSTAILGGLFAYLVLGGPWIFYQCQELIRFPAMVYDQPFEIAMQAVCKFTMIKIAMVTLPALGVVFIVGVGVNFIQSGPLLVLEPVKPDLKKIDPISKLKQMFSLKNLIETLKSIVKLVFLSILLYIVMRESIPDLLGIPMIGTDGMLAVIGNIFFRVVIYTMFAYVVIAAADYFFQRWQYTKGLKMSKAEVKQEYKEMEGDPTIKSKRKQLHQEMAMSDRMDNVRKSSALVTNPTHLAIAIFYEEGNTKLPMVLAMGEDLIAKRMIEVAREADVPVMQNIPLAWNLYENAEIEQYISLRTD